MTIPPKHTILRDLPVLLTYYVFPFIGISFGILFHKFANFEFVWILFILYIFLRLLKIKVKRHTAVVIYLFAVAIIFKYAAPFIWMKSVSLRPLIMDMKWVIYLFIAFFWIRIFGLPRKETFYKGALFFSKIYILYTIFNLLKGGGLRTAILSESNYDCYLILVGYCFISVCKHSKRDYIYFFLSTALSLSQTGLASFLAITCLMMWRNHKLTMIVLAPLGMCLVGALYYIRRGDADVSSIDRYIYFQQAFEYIASSDILTILFGTFPGKSISIHPHPVFDYYIRLFEEKNHIKGCYAFYFHSTYLRFALSWGITSLIIIFSYCFYTFFKTKYRPLKYIITLFLLQSVSLSALTLTTVSVIFFMAFIYCVKTAQIDKRPNHSKQLNYEYK